jgi:asparagine synthase (glutamine-hydrolysing)
VPQPVVPGGWFADAVRVVRHRGPDGSGYWVPGSPGCRPIQELDGELAAPASVALGFSRLAILDLTPAAEQPFVVPGQAALVHNGEIYNYVELRRELESAGWSFTSTGDTEVLIKAYLQWGTDAMRRFDGMWAFAIRDERRGGLLLSRDRFGEKPLFWTAWNGGVAFASEVKQLVGYPGVRRLLDRRRAAGFLVTGRPHDGPSSWFEDIHQLEPGTWLWADASGIRRGSYFDLRREVGAVSPETSPADWAARFGDAFSSSVRRRLRSDVPVGTSLSSGIDSSMVLAEAIAQGHESYRAFTLGSDDPRIDESGPAGRFAARQGATWHPVRADEHEFAALWDRMTWHQESPVASTSLYGQWKVFETAAATGVVVVLDGQGSDEILGGYNKFVASLLWRAAMSDRRRLPGAALGFVRQVGTLERLRWAGYRYFGRSDGTAGWLRPGLYDGERAPRVRADALEQRIQDIQRWSLPNLLSYADRNAMAHSVETRLPFLDHALVILALAMPDDALFRDGWTKWPLRVSLARRAGAHPAWTPGKLWFGVPQQPWLRRSLRPYVEAWRTSPHPAWAELLDPSSMRGFQEAWGRQRPSYPRDDRVFKMVALDRFLHQWFPA